MLANMDAVVASKGNKSPVDWWPWLYKKEVWNLDPLWDGKCPLFVTSNMDVQGLIIFLRKLLFEIENDIIPVIAGFQGISKSGRVSTLGRGGVDTTAVAVAAALKASLWYLYRCGRCLYNRPENGFFSKKLDRVSHEEMLKWQLLAQKFCIQGQ